MSHSTSMGSNREAWTEENIDRDVTYMARRYRFRKGIFAHEFRTLYVQRLPFKAFERLYDVISLPHCFIQRFDSSGIF